jgi:hypothetical protein
MQINASGNISTPTALKEQMVRAHRSPRRISRKTGHVVFAWISLFRFVLRLSGIEATLKFFPAHRFGIMSWNPK